MKKNKKMPVNSVGKLIKNARIQKNLSIEELVWKINKPQITKDILKKWEKGQEFPNLDNIYILAEYLDLNPNELLQKRLTIQDESIHEINPSLRRISEKVFNVLFVIVKKGVKWIGVICIIYIILFYQDFTERMGPDPEQDDYIEDIIVNAVKDYTIFNAVNDERYKPPPLKEYFRKKNYKSIKTVENNIDENSIIVK